MLKLKDVKKTYIMGDTKVEALKGISLNFRNNEFVSILGPSGCGKTTLLNIIGGLDKYTSGDLLINGISTKQFKDYDWDIYRNHRIGFIFQSYNLIPHQTILENVELALTIGGIEKKERIERAKNALDKVGLKDQYNKKPNQLSGGQCQRVAIARALVNEPEILLADEPTGALDTVTSIQIMELIKEISKEKLVIMVTHNPELAEKYSTRIVRLLDGEINSDSNPCSDEEEVNTTISDEEINKKAKTKMSFWTAFKLSGRNLLSKLKRSLMVGLAGSIGIIGISLVLALSNGIRTYIDDMQEDMLSGNPITITESALDLNAITNSMSYFEKTEIVVKQGIVSVSSILEFLAKRASLMDSIMVNNNITQEYIDYISEMPKEYVEEISYGYGVNMLNNIYTDFYTSAGGEKKTTSLSVIKQVYAAILGETEFKDAAAYISTLSSSMLKSINNEEYINSQYDILSGKIATKKNEIMIVVDKNQQLSDLLLAQLGYYSQEEFLDMARKAFDPDNHKSTEVKTEFDFDQLLNKTFVWYPNDALFKRIFGSDTTPFMYNAERDPKLNHEGIELNVVGILRPKEGINYGTLTSGFYYTSELLEEVLKSNKTSKVVKYLVDNNMTGYQVNTTDPSKSCIIPYTIDYVYEGETKTLKSIVTGKIDMMSAMMGTATGALTIRDLGGNDMPNSVSVYPVDFNLKEKVLEYLDAWNGEDNITLNGITYTKDQRSKITYTDNLSLVISMINTMINIVTIALVSFTAISLIVSTVMIGIITYVSVVERVKEIGVIRSLGGRKRDVANLFNAETFIIGLLAGTIGIVITYIISLIANLIIGSLTNIYTLVSLPIVSALIMITISILLTLISGLFPAKAAANMDPVNALRSE